MVDVIPHLLGEKKVVSDDEQAFIPVYEPASGQHIAHVAKASKTLCDEAVQIAQKAQLEWGQRPAIKRAQVLFKFRQLLLQNQVELAHLVTREHGKTLDDAKGSIMRAIEVVELHCGLLTEMQGAFSQNVANGIDTMTHTVPLGVCAGVSPFNFPVMVPAWMMVPAIAAGNAFILKPSEQAPSAPNKMLELLHDAGLPSGVINILHGDKQVVEHLIQHPHIAAMTAVASTSVARSIYTEATRHAKRAHTFGGAKNHAVVMPDADLSQASKAIVGAAYGSAGERCMALSVVVAVGEETANQFISLITPQIKAIRVDRGDADEVDMGPLISQAHLDRVLSAIETGEREGAKLVVDGRHFKQPMYPNGYYLGPTLFDNVLPSMQVYQEEIFGPVLVVVRVKHFEDALALVNANQYGNGTAIFTQSGYYARAYTNGVQVGMVGVNIPIPVPVASHPFGGWKQSSFGDTMMHGSGQNGHSMHFYTKTKTVTTKWPHAEERSTQTFVMPINT